MQFHRRSRPTFVARLLVLFSALQVVPISDVLTQTPPVVNYGPGVYGAHRRRIIDFITQSRTVMDEIAQIEAVPWYCSQQARLDDGTRLVTARAHLDALNASWTAYKLGMTAQFSIPSVIAAFVAAGENPGAGNFWFRADQEVISLTVAALAAAEARWRASVVRQCTQQRTNTPPAPPVAPAAPRANPLAGFTRPHVPARSVLPTIPRPFCTEADRRAWEAANIAPVLDEIRTAANAVRVYSARLYDQMQVQRTRNDTAAIRILDQEFKWAIRTHQELDAVYYLFVRLRDSLVVIDCSQPRTPSRPQPAPVTPRPDPRTGLARPNLPNVPRLPRARDSFCTDAEKAAWITENIDLLLEEFYNATDALQSYRLQVLDAMKRLPTVDSSMVFEGELQWIRTRQDTLNARYFELIALRNGLKVVPCDRPRTQERPKDPPRVGRARTLRIGLSGEYAYFDQFRNVAGNQPGITGITGSNGTPGVGAGIGVDWGRKSCMLSGHANSLTYGQTYAPTAPNVPIKSMGTVDGMFVDVSCGLKFQPWELVEFTPYFGPTLAIDRLHFDNSFSSGPTLDGDRQVNHLKTNFGFKIVRPLFNDFDLQFDFTRTTGRWTGDADANTRVGLGVFYNFRF